MFAVANAAAKTFPVYFSFNGCTGGDGLSFVALPFGNSGTDIFFPNTFFIFLFQMEFNRVKENIFC